MIVRQPAFHLLFWSFLICGFTTTGVIETHLLPFASFCGFPPIPSATAYGLLSLVNLVGMIVAGWLTDRVNRPMLLATIYGLRALTFVLLGSLPGTSIEMLFLFAVLFGGSRLFHRSCDDQFGGKPCWYQDDGACHGPNLGRTRHRRFDGGVCRGIHLHCNSEL